MGTSVSSDGPGGGVPFDPPWLDDIDVPHPGNLPPTDDQDLDSTDLEGEPSGPPPTTLPPTPGIAPSGRFRNARRELRNFARTGSKDAFARALGHYSRTGMGGASNVANRMRMSAVAGANAFVTLQAVRENRDPAIREWVNSLIARNANAYEIIDEIVRYTMPSGGSIDEKACQESMDQALQDLIANDLRADLLNLTDDNIWVLIKSFLGHEAFHRLYLDIGQIFENSEISPRERVIRMKEMRDYLKAELSAQFDLLREDMARATPGTLQFILQRAIKNTFIVYERSI